MGERSGKQVARWAAAQWGVVTTRQLSEAGLHRNTIARLVRDGLYQPLFHGTYFLGAGPVPSHAWWMAGVLAAGPGALLSHASAAGLWGMLPELILPVHVTIPSPGNRRSRTGLRIHRSRTLEAGHAATRHGIPLTTPERTIRDLPRHLRDRAVNQALVDRLLTVHPVPHLPMTRSRAERIFLRNMKKANLPLPWVNVLIEGRERDYVWHAERLVVELDGPHHDQEPQRRVDRARSRELTLAGWRVLGFSTDEIADMRSISTIAEALARG